MNKLRIPILLLLVFSVGFLFYANFAKQKIPILGVDVPNVLGMNIDKATRLLSQKELGFEEPIYSCNTKITSGIVFDQNPLAMEVKSTTKVILYVSKGSCE